MHGGSGGRRVKGKENEKKMVKEMRKEGVEKREDGRE